MTIQLYAVKTQLDYAILEMEREPRACAVALREPRLVEPSIG